jgi:hypothetical protein
MTPQAGPDGQDEGPMGPRAPSPWFPGTGRTEDEEAFLAALRTCAEADGLGDATPADTDLLAWDGVLVLVVELPGVRDLRATPVLEVLVRLSGGEAGMSCGCEYGHLGEDDEPMDLRGVERSPAALGRHAIDWFTGQLHRPVERATWSTWRGPRSLVRFADDGELIGSDLWRRRPRREPRSLVRVR